MGCSGSACLASRDNGQGMHAEFLLGTELGKGRFGRVRSLTRRATGEELAVKMVKSEDARLDVQVQSEYLTWKKAGDHTNIVRLESFMLETLPGAEGKRAYFIMERCGDSLRGHLPALASNESLRMSITHDVLSGIAHIHDHNIVHRDVKFDNLLFSGRDVKICDFGVASQLPTCGFLTSVTGTAPYMAPEVVLEQNYGKKVDVWSYGVCLYYMIYQKFPYMPKAGEKGAAAFKAAIADGSAPSFNSQIVVVKQELELVQAMMHRSATNRCGAEQGLRMFVLEKALEAEYAASIDSRSTCEPSLLSSK